MFVPEPCIACRPRHSLTSPMGMVGSNATARGAWVTRATVGPRGAAMSGFAMGFAARAQLKIASAE